MRLLKKRARATVGCIEYKGTCARAPRRFTSRRSTRGESPTERRRCFFTSGRQYVAYIRLVLFNVSSRAFLFFSSSFSSFRARFRNYDVTEPKRDTIALVSPIIERKKKSASISSCLRRVTELRMIK